MLAAAAAAASLFFLPFPILNEQPTAQALASSSSCLILNLNRRRSSQWVLKLSSSLPLSCGRNRNGAAACWFNPSTEANLKRSDTRIWGPKKVFEVYLSLSVENEGFFRTLFLLSLARKERCGKKERARCCFSLAFLSCSLWQLPDVTSLVRQD